MTQTLFKMEMPESTKCSFLPDFKNPTQASAPFEGNKIRFRALTKVLQVP